MKKRIFFLVFIFASMLLMSQELIFRFDDITISVPSLNNQYNELYTVHVVYSSEYKILDYSLDGTDMSIAASIANAMLQVEIKKAISALLENYSLKDLLLIYKDEEFISRLLVIITQLVVPDPRIELRIKNFYFKDIAGFEAVAIPQ